jgi:hypothetical protein
MTEFQGLRGCRLTSPADSKDTIRTPLPKIGDSGRQLFIRLPVDPVAPDDPVDFSAGDAAL